MGATKNAILLAETSVQAALNDLLAEINSGENQDDDLIPVYPADISDINMIQDSLAHYRQYFNGPMDLEIIFNTADTLLLSVDVARFFDNPVDNPKNLLPGYELTINSVTDQYEICYGWDAVTFDGWTFPNPTINGLLPGITSDSLKSLMNIEASDWLQSDCDTTDVDF